MATFYIQLENKLLQISGDLTAENISKALGYVPVSPNVTNELSQRVDNITFDSLKDNPFLQDGSGELNIVDEAGNIIAKINAEGIHSVDFIAGEHRLSDKTDKTYVDEAVKNVKVDLTGYATEEYVNNIDFYNINNNPVINSEAGKLLFVDESGNIGLQLENDGLYVSNVFAGPHILSNKADKSEVPTSTSQLTNDSGYITKPVVDQAIASLVDSAPETLDTIGEIASALKNNANIVDILNQSISAKQNTIEDLEAIRAGASLGATALQEIPEEYAKKEDIPSLDGYATQAWVTNKNYATEEDLSSIEFNSLQNNPLVEDSNGEFNLVDDLGNVGFKVNQEGLFVKDVIAGNHVLSNKANVSDIPESITESTVSEWGFTKNIGTITGVKINGTTKSQSNGIVDLGTVITSHQTLKTINGESIIGDGNLILAGGNSDANVQAIDTNEVLEDVETNTYIKYVPQTLTEEQKAQVRANIGVGTSSTGGSTSSSDITEQTLLSWGFTKNTGTYSKPSGGIPKSDLASSIQTSLDKADTALQSYTEQYKGTITGITMNGSSKGTSGVIDLGTVITEHQNIDGKQDKLVSGTNIKTINGTSILGSGDISISGGSDVNTKWNPEYLGDYTGTSISLDPYKLYYGAAFETDTTITFNGEEDYREFRIIFYVAPNVSLSVVVDLWANGKIPDISAGGYFELSVVDNCGVLLGVLSEFKEL